MQNTPDNVPRSRLPASLIKLSQQLRVVIPGVLLAGIIGSLIMGVVSSAVYDLIKEQMLQNLWLDIVYLLLIALLVALIYVVSLHDVPEKSSQQGPKHPPAFLVRMVYSLLLLVSVVSIFWYLTPLRSFVFPPDTGLGVAHADGNDVPIGLCDGSCVIDTLRLNGGLKQEAAEQITMHNNVERACEYWAWASQDDTADAEAKVDYENRCALQSGTQYIDLAVVVQLAASDNVYLNGMSRSILQGAYLAQKSYNNAHPEGPKIYLFIANIGDPTAGNAKQMQQQVAEQILQTNDARNAHKIMGIIGLPYGSDYIAHALSGERYPMISIAPSNSLSGLAYYRSIAPTLQDETGAAVSFLKSQHRLRVALYSAYGYGGDYSANLIASFAQSFTGRLVVQNTYVRGSVPELNSSANVVADAGADAVYFIGPPDDASAFTAALHRLNPHIIVVGSDVIYQWVYIYHPGQLRDNFNGLFFTAFAYHSPPGTPKDHVSSMVALYRIMFNPNKYYVGYFYDQPGSDAILAFDAMNLATSAATNALGTNQKSLTAQSLWQALVSINSSQGFSGQISFSGANSSFPDQKAVFILSIQSAGNKYEGTYSGRY